MYEFILRSSKGSDLLKLWAVEPGELWRVRIEFDHLKAEAKVYERYSGSELRLDTYFGELADRWRGWKGPKEWESLGLNLAARHDGRGHITLDATLQDDYASGDRWKVRASWSWRRAGSTRSSAQRGRLTAASRWCIEAQAPWLPDYAGEPASRGKRDRFSPLYREWVSPAA